ncbi:hypothetical protein ACFLSP_01380 [Bacteroidota bacterium]
MEKKDKKIKLDALIVRDLWSEEENTVLKTIQNLRYAGNIHYLPELLKLLSKTENETIRKDLVRFLADIKDPAAIYFILKGLKDSELSSARADIVSTCWQSGLDYSQNLDVFVQLFMEGDYQTALECFTVIEESAFTMKEEDIEKIRILVVRGLEQVSEEKKPLAIELIKMLEA